MFNHCRGLFVYFFVCQHPPLPPWQWSLHLQNPLGVCWSHHCFCVSHQHYSLVLPPQFSSPRGGWEAADGLFKSAWAPTELWDGAWRRESRDFWGIVIYYDLLALRGVSLSLSLQSSLLHTLPAFPLHCLDSSCVLQEPFQDLLWLPQSALLVHTHRNLLSSVLPLDPALSPWWL